MKLLEESRWNKAEVARRLGVSRAAVLEVYEKMGYTPAKACLNCENSNIQISEPVKETLLNFGLFF